MIPPWEGPDEFEAGLHPNGSGVAPILESQQARRPLKYLAIGARDDEMRKQQAEAKRREWQAGPLGGNHRPITPINSHDLDEVI
jgi:hypothetical protein